MNRDNSLQNQMLEITIEGTEGAFKVFEIREVYFNEGEYQIINFSLNDPKSVDVNVRKIILNRL